MKKGDFGYIVYDKIVWRVLIVSSGPEKTRIDWYATLNMTRPSGRQAYELGRPTIEELPTSKVFSKKSAAAAEALRQCRAEFNRLTELLAETAVLCVESSREEYQHEAVQQQAA